MIEGVLGFFPFTVTPVEIATFDNLRQSRKIQYVQHKTMLDRPRVQHVGRELDTLSLLVRILPVRNLYTADTRINVLRAIAAVGEEMPLVLGLSYKGKFVLTDIEVEHKKVLYGVTLHADVTLNLLEYC